MTSILTGRERRSLVYAGIAIYGFAAKGWLATVARYLSGGLLVTEVLGYVQDQKLFVAPETMNAFFKSDGKLSGKDSPEAARVIRATGLVG